MNTIIPEDSSAVGRYTCLHEFHEARKAAYFKPTAPRPLAPICLSWSHLDIFIGKSHDRDLSLLVPTETVIGFICLLLLYFNIKFRLHFRQNFSSQFVVTRVKFTQVNLRLRTVLMFALKLECFLVKGVI